LGTRSPSPRKRSKESITLDAAAIAHQIASAYRPDTPGRPSRIGESDTVQILLEAINDGNYIETAAELAGLSKQAVYDWIKRGEARETPYAAFADAVKRATARAEAAEVAKVRNAGNDPRFWAASMTYLERRHPDRWARRSDDSSAPKVVVQIGVRDSDVQVSVQAGNDNADYQTRTLSEGVTHQQLTAAPIETFASEDEGRKP
jgi:hypothetical protein